jgi:hypothetical protein
LAHNGKIQSLLFESIRGTLQGATSFPEHVAGILGISTDSAYRRIRGEKELSFAETCILCRQAKLSLDQFLGIGDGHLLFSGKYLQEGVFEFTDFLREIRDALSRLSSFKNHQLIYQNKDISIFYYFMFPDLLAFKYHVWMKQHFGFSNFTDRPFSPDILSHEQMEILGEINRLFVRIPSVEIMNPDNVLTDLRQIEYYKLTGGFRSETDKDRVYRALEMLVDHLERQTQSGQKLLPSGETIPDAKSLTVYVHDFHYGDNETLMLADDHIITVLTHTSINFMHTTNPEMGAYSYDFMQNIIRKSTLISGAGEKFRTRFFNIIRERILQFRNNEVNSLLK